METVGISDISRNPALFNKDEIFEIVDKKSKKSKYIAIPSHYKPLLEKVIEEIEYRRWLEKNRQAFQEPSEGDEWEKAQIRAIDTL